MNGESLRQSNTDRAAADLKPEGMKSTSESLGDTLATAGDSVASYVPGQEKTRDNFTDNAHSHSLTHDTGRSAGGEAVKPAGGQGLMGSIEQKADQAASYVQPNKSNTQEARDTVTPGHHSATKDEGKGVMGQVGDAIVGAKDAVAGALGGSHSHQQQTRDL